jgi:hypothetical protein
MTFAVNTQKRGSKPFRPLSREGSAQTLPDINPMDSPDENALGRARARDSEAAVSFPCGCVQVGPRWSWLEVRRCPPIQETGRRRQ